MVPYNPKYCKRLSCKKKRIRKGRDEWDISQEKRKYKYRQQISNELIIFSPLNLINLKSIFDEKGLTSN